MDTAEIRRRFLAHFERDGHTPVPSASLLLDDPNLLFVNAGMVPFKPYFLGQETPPYDRATSVQKCVRTADIEDVGKTTRHNTFFEMCGNFSFGDYFKEHAIELAWELVTRPQADGGWGLEESRLYPSVYDEDAEAVELWKKVTGLPDERILRLGKKENYWSMGVPGPGGPCSEILYDRGPAYGPDFDPTKLGPDMPVELEDRLLEIWNLVFMQDELSAVRSKADFDISGSLPKKNIDTGMGLERVAFLLQGKENNYEIDVLYPVITRAEELTGRRYGADHQDDVRFRVVTDHVRSSMMLIADGVTPGNEARGYVLRRLLRRAVRSMRLLGYDNPALPELLPISRDKMGETYTDLHTDWDRISRVAYAEEEAFRKTLQAGTQIFDLAAQDVKKSGSTTLSGDQAFSLHDTYGFPFDLTLEMASEAGLAVDEAGFRALMSEQRERAKADARSKRGQHADTGVYRAVLDEHGPTDWRAYETLETESNALALLVGGAPVASLADGEVGELILDRTPFYAESGGQAADAGTIEFDGGRLEVLDVQRPVRGLVVHQVRVVDGEFTPGRVLHARVDPDWRTGARQAHSGTHVVHAALREVLGPSALQSGSYNRPGYLRLDFGWTTGLSPEQVRDIEQVSNQALRADLPVGWQYMTLPEARDWGAIALFGETYDDQKVRVVEIGGPWSRELCGGTHVDHSSQIGTIVVTGEASVGSGNRRIEAFTGVEGFAYLAHERDVVAQLTGLLKTQPDDLVGRVGDLVERLRAAEKEIEKARVGQVLAAAGQLASGATKVGPVNVVAHRADGAGGGDVRTLALDVRGRLPQGEPGVVVVLGAADGKVAVVAAVNDEARARGLSANDLVRAVGPLVGGKGGGKDDVAQGGGTDTSRIDEAVALVIAEVGRVAGA
ncbi:MULTISPECIES: alanine--tRNA ligase [unclassified Nocardioides]|uniref:alanine--tRNA ligase n=1 Tax=unclassified Nocardioides TaxID=2615069 RepID=UPI0009F101AE|nr:MULTISPECIES: alanine--tRNA ligase [unclassified Nocardioides]GAW49469.1 alanyl-tRNA synthetase [Nocardioides sp. PD653-B2]GAW55017.1 alanyl-tRNA synthetase [Nocardioides sp. PD653]